MENEGMCIDIIAFDMKDCIVVNGMGDLQYHVSF